MSSYNFQISQPRNLTFSFPSTSFQNPFLNRSWTPSYPLTPSLRNNFSFPAHNVFLNTMSYTPSIPPRSFSVGFDVTIMRSNWKTPSFNSGASSNFTKDCLRLLSRNPRFNFSPSRPLFTATDRLFMSNPSFFVGLNNTQQIASQTFHVELAFNTTSCMQTSRSGVHLELDSSNLARIAVHSTTINTRNIVIGSFPNRNSYVQIEEISDNQSQHTDDGQIVTTSRASNSSSLAIQSHHPWIVNFLQTIGRGMIEPDLQNPDAPLPTVNPETGRMILQNAKRIMHCLGDGNRIGQICLSTDPRTSMPNCIIEPNRITASQHFNPAVDFEMMVQINVTHPNLSQRYNLGRPELKHGAIGLTNGILNSLSEANRSSLLLSSYAGRANVHSVYNASIGFMGDVGKTALGMAQPSMTMAAENLQETWNHFFSNAGPNERFLQFCHSGGTAQVYIALLTYPVELRNRIEVVAVAPSKYISKNLCYKVTHLESSDFVPRLDRRGRLECADTIIVLEPHPDVSWFNQVTYQDHAFSSPTYQEFISKYIKNFIKEEEK